MRELDGGGDAELRKACDVLGREALRVLDPLAEATRAPGVLRALEGVEGCGVGGVADRVHADRPTRRGTLAHDLLELLARRDHDAAALRHPRRLRPERPVHERLEVAEPEERRAGAAAEPDLPKLGETVGRRRLPDAEWQPALLFEPLPEPDRAEPAVLVVDGRDPACRREPHAVAHRLDVLLVRRARVPLFELPGRALVEDARRLPACVADDDAALDLEVAVREREGGRVEPEGVVVLRDQHRRALRLDLVERLPRRRAVGPVRVAPALAALPAPFARRRPYSVERLGE